jgi:hypothetical protein
VAQTNVYSINAVGYINVTLAPGFNILACQLQTTNNTLGSLLNNASGAYNGCEIFKYTPAHPGYVLDLGDSSGSSYANGWDNNGTVTMNPGECIWFNNGFTTNITATFVGTVPQGTNTVPIIQGYQMIASPVPFSGDVVTNMQFTNYSDSSEVYVYNNPAPGKPRGGYTLYFVDLQGGSQGYKSQWDSPGDPKVNVGQGFFYNSGLAPQAWVQVFSINP